ncbi:hypothetical protein [Streptomyces sp. AC1-42W]|uniref:hypothetical protein n=1 Tax=Streptomyces sp. AC1-42W TaxID=2218666 RepID=UPI0011B942F5|nr:hypothetical protein [Streptomyces sp. AC1-42W]
MITDFTEVAVLLTGAEEAVPEMRNMPQWAWIQARLLSPRSQMRVEAPQFTGVRRPSRRLQPGDDPVGELAVGEVVAGCDAQSAELRPEGLEAVTGVECGQVVVELA